MNTRQQQQGFTIIEVVLVLAIAALIFLMVFVALPALQASQRDTARKNDASIVASGVTKFTSSEGAPVSTSTSAADLQKYIDKLDQYEVSNVVIANALTVNPTATQVMVYPSAQCSGTNVASATTSRKLAVRVMLDNGTTYHCVNAS